MVEKRFPELTYTPSDKILTGSYHGESITLIVDNIVWKSAKKFMSILDKNSSLTVYAKNKNSDSDKYSEYTIGEFLYLMEKTYAIRINQRFKGLTH